MARPRHANLPGLSLMAIESSDWLAKAFRVVAGIFLGALLGAVAGVLWCVVFAADHTHRSGGGLLLGLFLLAVVVGNVAVGVILGILAAFSPRHRSDGLINGAAVGFAIGLIVLVALPRIIAALKQPESGSDMSDSAGLTMGLSLLIILTGAVIGWRLARKSGR